MKKHMDKQNKNILIETDCNQQFLINHDFCIKNEFENNNECKKENFTDLGYKIDNYKDNTSDFRILKRETHSICELDTRTKIENDVTVFNGCVFTNEMEISMTRLINKNNKNTEMTEKNANVNRLIDYDNNHHLTVGEQIHNRKKEYHCEICDKRFKDKYNLKMHNSLHANIKVFTCTTCGEQFLESNVLKSHLISHIDNNINMIEKQFLQECNDGECNTTFCNNNTMLDGLKTNRSKDGLPTEKRTINKVRIDFSVEIEEIFSTEASIDYRVYSIDSKKCDDSVGNAVNSCASVSLDESYIASSVAVVQKELKNDKKTSDLKKHQDLHSRHKPYKCIQCGKSFVMEKSLAQHLRKHDGLKPYQCALCDESCSTIFDFRCHKRVHNGENPYKCDICGDSFTQLTDWKKHKQIHFEYKNFKCNDCHKKYASKTSVRNHIVAMHLEQNKKYNCKVCFKQFSRYSYLYAHEKIHNKFKPFVCNICEKKFISHHNYTNHLNKHTGAKPYMCDLCGKSYSAMETLRKHKKIKHMCGICNKFYSDPLELEVHLTTHQESELKPHVCNLCYKAFRYQSALNKHKLTHRVDKPFKCDFCPKSFLKKNVLTVHRRNHTGEMPYKCNLCYKIYPQKSSLSRHKTIVHN